MKSSYIQIRVSPEQKEAIRASAEQAHCEMSTWVLQKIFPDPQAKLLDILGKLKKVEDSSERSFVLNALATFLSRLTARDLQLAISNKINVGLNELMDNYVAAMIEHACVLKKNAPPLWLNEKTGVHQPFFGVGLQSMRLYLLTVSPISFRKRNIFIDASLEDII